MINRRQFLASLSAISALLAAGQCKGITSAVEMLSQSIKNDPSYLNAIRKIIANASVGNPPTISYKSLNHLHYHRYYTVSKYIEQYFEQYHVLPSGQHLITDDPMIQELNQLNFDDVIKQVSSDIINQNFKPYWWLEDEDVRVLS